MQTTVYRQQTHLKHNILIFTVIFNWAKSIVDEIPVIIDSLNIHSQRHINTISNIKNL
ncbi:hypothetical protein [Nostoc sp.]|uniref:hypothetical protein n=1 Tax=Nostoc sp. TaxID=1180 RepID=UPI002FFCBFC2